MVVQVAYCTTLGAAIHSACTFKTSAPEFLLCARGYRGEHSLYPLGVSNPIVTYPCNGLDSALKSHKIFIETTESMWLDSLLI